VLVLLSPAKKLNAAPAVPAGASPAQPPLLDHAETLMETARPLTRGDLKSLMHISDDLAELNHQRFQEWTTPFTTDNASPALLTFAGDVYIGIDTETLSADDLGWAQDHVVILSGLYGVLRPLDLMQPYRLEMGTSLENPRGRNLVAFWREAVTSHLAERLKGDSEPVIVNLASQEYFKSVDHKALGARIITPVFQDIKDGKARTLFFFAKRARGAMTRWIVDHRVDDPEALKAFDGMGYAYDEDASDRDRWVFRRKQPPPAR
jgi:cytoplasmic iron level regulating protein YaaA (DUF328/UPF0246 family)